MEYRINSYRSIYKNVFEGYDLEIHLTDHCNLNCASCNHFSPLAEPFYITIEDFKHQLMLVKETLPTLKTLMLIGGEPLLHPDLIKLCQIARDIFPDIIIDIYTNGILLDKFSDKDMKILKKLNIYFSIGLYPSIDYKNKLLKIDLNNIQSFKSHRFFFGQTLVDIKGEQNAYYNFINCHKHKIPCFTLKDYKIYICPFCAHIDHFCNYFSINIPKTEKDYLVLNNQLTLQQLQDFCFIEKDLCKYCKSDFQAHSWTQSSRTLDEFTCSNKELYLNNYFLYNQLINSNSYFNYQYKNRLDANFAEGTLEKNNLKFGNGKIDIIIPFYKINKELFNLCIQSLAKQSIINECMVYLISDESPDENYVYDICSNYLKNVFFFKTNKNSGAGVARNIGLNNSFNPYIFFLDADDYLYNSDLLENLYNLIINTNLDIIEGQTIEYDEIRNNISISKVPHCCLFKRKDIEKYNILFGESYLYEDDFFFSQIDYYQLKRDRVNLGYYIYNLTSPVSVVNGKKHLYLFYTYSFIKFLLILEHFKYEKTFYIDNSITQLFSFNHLIEILQYDKNLKENELKNCIDFIVCLYCILNHENILFNKDFIYNNIFLETINQSNIFCEKFLSIIDSPIDFNYYFKIGTQIVNILFSEKYISENYKNIFIQKGDELINGSFLE